MFDQGHLNKLNEIIEKLEAQRNWVARGDISGFKALNLQSLEVFELFLNALIAEPSIALDWTLRQSFAISGIKNAIPAIASMEHKSLETRIIESAALLELTIAVFRGSVPYMEGYLNMQEAALKAATDALEEVQPPAHFIQEFIETLDFDALDEGDYND